MMLMTLMAAAALAAAQPPAADRAVEIGQGAQTLHGSLMRPERPKSRVAVLLIGGSGSENRDGDSPAQGTKAHTMRLLAEALAERGVSSLRYDKRGSGESAPAGDPATIQQLAGDAADWTRFLAKQPGVDCVVILGHSEGAEIGTLAAHKVKLCGLVLISGAGRNVGEVIESQGALARRTPEQAAQVHAILQALRTGAPVPEVPKGYESLFGPAAIGYMRSQIAIEPAAELAEVKVPVLVVQGDNDLQITVDDARRLAAAARVEPVIIPGANHPLKLAPKDMMGNMLTYLNPDLPLAPGIAEAVGDFVVKRGPR